MKKKGIYSYQDVLKILNREKFQLDSTIAMDRLKMQEKIKFFSSFKRVLTTDLSNIFYEDLNKRANGEMEDNFVIFMYGEKGTFKSSIAISLATMFYPEFDPKKHLVFTNNDLKKRIPFVKAGCLVRDETTRDYGTGSNQLASEIQMFTETLRKRKTNLIFLCPSQHNLPTVDYIIHTFKGNFCKKNKQALFGILDQGSSQRFIGGVRVPLLWESEIWNSYNVMKDQWLEKFANTDYATSNILEDSYNVMNMKGFDLCNKKGEIEIFTKRILKGAVVQHQQDIATSIWQIKNLMEENAWDLDKAFAELGADRKD